MSEEVTLAAALRRLAKTPNAEEETPAQSWERIGRRALSEAGITVTDEQAERAWRALWQRSFMGGNYTLDARAMLRAVTINPYRSQA